MADPGGPSLKAMELLRLLKRHHNVLLCGPPGTGKSRLLNEVERWFRATAHPAHLPGAAIPLPAGLTVPPAAADDWLPSPRRIDRQTFQTSFHPGSKYRDFLRGIVPVVGAGGGFTVTRGTLYRAATVGLGKDGAALVVIDEINRGPAVHVFGDSLVALERDKRLGEGGETLTTTQYFDVLNDEGVVQRFALPRHLYILAAMNQADTSVEPLDVAFLRRWEPYRLAPSLTVVRDYFGLGDAPDIPEEATESAHVYAAAIRAWQEVNRRISLGRGPEYQLGHGVFLEGDEAPPTDVEDALKFIATPWGRIRAHVEEVFFGHTRGVAAVLNVGAPGHPLTLTETYFAGDPVVALSGSVTGLYALLVAVGSADVN